MKLWQGLLACHIPQFDAPAIDRKEDDYCTSMLSERQCKKLNAIPRGVYKFFCDLFIYLPIKSSLLTEYCRLL